jgi:ATP-dependent RNA helicase RhlE
MSFNKLDLIKPILDALTAEGYTAPTPIQKQAIPIVLKQRDLLACAQTGTGKTAAFACPIIQLINRKENRNNTIKSLILTPTRELAIQIDESFAAYGKFTDVTHTVIFGGVSQQKQVTAIKKGVDVLVATPGRLLDLINQGIVNIRSLEIFVLDEADRMLDMGFIHDVKKIISHLPSKRQTLFFSATMPPEIQKLSASLLTNPEKVEVTPQSTTVEKIEQTLYYTNKANKQDLLLHLLLEKGIFTALVFTRTKHGANKLVKFLNRTKVKSAAIHGNKSQTARQKALSDFKDGNIEVLVATDIAARGIDIDELTHVFNYNLPDVPETYVHRIGRTGRAGKEGIAIAFCDSEERSDLRAIEKMLGKSIPLVEDHPFPADKNSFNAESIPNKPNKSYPRRSNNPNSGGNNRNKRNFFKSKSV